MPGDDLRQSSIAILDVPLRGLGVGEKTNTAKRPPSLPIIIETQYKVIKPKALNTGVLEIIQEPVFPFITADGRIVASSYAWTTPTMPGSRPAMTSLDSRSVWNLLPSSVR
ncbi:hypothetical protein CTAM01_09353 [Colletotrichum tamarilloi]|uniref:Uncharacterized protein n=1 Tax=Colletotrichum tamarilloi TaxID=1209934 RepID=A0ABQ9R4C2_9PEZI|nr:uncharacterized protein CTAM01_09353 [Colletotrichum tamarilloi]KAK1493892.1 hypothetical protein CTAM01_09353 [Colletotrichum tamarilloi]